MIRSFIGIVGVITALFPDRILELFEEIALQDVEETTTREWIRSGIRVEGVLVAAVSLLGGRAYAWMMNLTGLFGGIVLVVPELYRDFAIDILYENPDDVEWDEGFDRIVRVIGIAYLLVAAREFLRRRADD